MGLTVHTSFTTSQGFSVSSVYLRIAEVRVTFPRAGGRPDTVVWVSAETYLTREAYVSGGLTLSAPTFPPSFVIVNPQADCIQHSVLYAHIKTQLEAQGFTVEDVFEPAPEPAPEPTPEASPQSSESTPSTLPTPPTPSESAPPESQPEPQPQSSSEYAPAPAAPEA
jgi:hypothetical protein